MLYLKHDTMINLLYLSNNMCSCVTVVFNLYVTYVTRS